MATEAEIAWAAGLFEGEGCFTLGNQHRDVPTFHAVLQMVDEDVVRKFHGIIGYGVVHSSTVTSTGKQIFRWTCTRREHFKAVALTLRPHLGERRRSKVDELLALMRALT